jgi:subtilisin family serine protease
MRGLRPLTVVAALCLGIGAATLSGQQPPPRAQVVDGEILVKFRPGADDARRDAALNGIGGTRIKRFKDLNVDHVRLPQGRRANDVIQDLLSNADVVSAQPNFVRRISFPGPPNDPWWTANNTDLYGIKKIGADSVWNTFNNKGSAGVVVADIDTGVKYDHPDLAANMWINPGEVAGNAIDDDGNGYVDDVRGIDTFNHDSNPMDDNGHGTHTAGTIGGVGNNGIGVVGVNWTVKILPCKFLDSAGNGTDAGAIECFNYITWLKNHGINILVSNNSWGGYRDTSQPFPQLLKDAIDTAGNAGIINIFAAGNDGLNIDTFPHDPASFTSPSIVSVTASRSNDLRASFSNYGAVAVDLAAPGDDIWSTYIDVPAQSCFNCYARLDGTSMATPHVAGAAALLLAQSPAMPVSGTKALLISSVNVISQWTNLVASGGRLNVFAAAGMFGVNTPPTVSITGPAPGATFQEPATIPIAASASDSGSIYSVEFFANGVSIGIDTSAPYAGTGVNVPAGNYTLTAKATDNLGAQTTSAPVSIVVNPLITEAMVNQAVTSGGTRLQQLQNADGGWYFRAIDTSCGAGAGVSCPNTIGVTGLGLLSAYERGNDPGVLADAVAAGQRLQAIHAAAPSQQPFSQDLEFLVALTDASGDPQYAALANSWFGTITAMHPIAADRVDYSFTRRNQHTIAVWDVASTIRMAKAAGNVSYATGLANRIVARETDWKHVDADYTLLDMGSMLWAMHDLPGFDAKITEYRSWLLSQQDAQGSWAGGDLQITSYVVMGLGAVGGAGTSAAIQSAVLFLLDNQLPNFGWPFWVDGGSSGLEYPMVDSEVMRAIASLYSTQAGQSVQVTPAQLATVTFSDVSAPGSTTVVAQHEEAPVPFGYAIVEGLTYNVQTSATVSGASTVCFAGSLTAGLANARVLHKEGGKFVDRTSTANCAEASDLSIFAIATVDPNAIDSEVPQLTVTLSPSSLSPANNKLVTIAATIDVQDNADPSPTITLVSITIGGSDKGQKEDIEDAAIGTDDRSFRLRAEKGKSGRVYTITYRATDRSGNVTEVAREVVVP